MLEVNNGGMVDVKYVIDGDPCAPIDGKGKAKMLMATPLPTPN